MKGFIVHITYKDPEAEKCLDTLQAWADHLNTEGEATCVLTFIRQLQTELANPRPLK